MPWELLIGGFANIFSFGCLFWVSSGAILGTVVGVLPGLGPTATLAILLPITYGLSPLNAMVFLSGLAYGTQYGGSTTSILVNIPGEATSVVTCFDGYKMAQQGRAGPALCIAAIGSWIGGTISIIGLTFCSPILANLGVKIGPPEYFGLASLGIIMISYLSVESRIGGFIAATLGLLLATIGQDALTGNARLTFGNPYLLGGFDFASVAMGLFGVGEILFNLSSQERIGIASSKIGRLWLSAKDWAEAKWSVFRGSALGFILGIIPGAGGIMSTILSYTIEKRLSRTPERFGRGAIEGVAAPESANNAACISAFIPLLTLGIPPNVVMAIIYGAFIMHGIEPGPLMMVKHPDVFWGLIASMYLANIILVILNLPLVGIWVQLLRIPVGLLSPLILTITLIGAYSLNNSSFDVWAVICFGFLGYMLRKFKIDGAPLVLGFILGPLIEKNFRRSLVISDGDMSIFYSRPLPLIIILIAVILIGWEVVRVIKKINSRITNVK